MTVPVYTTFNGLARRTRIPVATLSRRIRQLGIEPDAITAEGKRPSVLLFDVRRLPELRQALIASGPETEVVV